MSELDIHVRDCHAADISALAGMMRDIWHDTAGYRKVEEWCGVKVGGKHWWEHKAEEVRLLFESHPERVVVAEVEGKVAGYATFRIEADNTGRIGENGVHPLYRRRGVGKRLHQEVVRRLREAGIELVFVVTTLENEAARQIYESHGFRTIHTNVLMVNKLERESG
jgi:ribosomal protein S18 acetylase RimI-like enzyme